VAALDQVEGHGFAHDAESDEADVAHLILLTVMRWMGLL
jgi:hypothetical protein